MSQLRKQRWQRLLFPLLGMPLELRLRHLLDRAAIRLWENRLKEARSLLAMPASGNGPLRTRAEIESSVAGLRAAGLPTHHERAKNWDLLRALRTIVRTGSVASSVMDAGCGATGGVLLPSLKRLGFTNLCGLDLAIARDVVAGGVLYLKRNIEATGLSSSTFEFIASLSVIEHGVDLKAFFREMSRLLRPGGVLLVSTDYWDVPIDTSGVRPFRGVFGEMRVFGAKDVPIMLDTAREYDLHPFSPFDLSTVEKTVRWEGRDYTFLYFELRKKGTHEVNSLQESSGATPVRPSRNLPQTPSISWEAEKRNATWKTKKQWLQHN